MRGAVGLAFERGRTAEEEVRLTGIAHRPTAGAAVELQKRAALPERHIGVDARIIDIRLGVAHPGRQVCIVWQRRR